MAIIHILHFQRGDRLQSSESDVYRRQILTSKDGLRAKKVEHHTTNANGRRNLVVLLIMEILRWPEALEPRGCPTLFMM